MSFSDAIFKSRHRLNVCFAYTSRQEMTSSVDVLARAVQAGILDPNEIDAELLNYCFWSRESTPPDLLIRTSGEIRLSDFLLWQSSHSVLSFTPVLWPEFSIWHLIQAVFYYQRNKLTINVAEDNQHSCREELKQSIDDMRTKLRRDVEEKEIVK